MATTSLASPVPPSRRHSLTPPSRRPLRSSPLAGPSFNLSPDGRLELSPLDAAKAKPNRISSTPDLPSLSDAHLQLPKRISTPPMIPIRSSLPSPPPSPHNASHRSKPRDSFVSLPTHTQVPHFPRVYTSKSTPSSPSSSYTSLPDQSWLTANPYLTTPKFSRLSLGSPNVVMPVSAKERRRSMASASVDGHTKVSSATFDTDRKATMSRRKSIVSMFSKSPNVSVSSPPPAPPTSTRSASSIRTSRSLRSLRSFRSRRSTSTSTSECDVIAEIQDEFGTIKEADVISVSESDSASSAPSLPTPASSTKSDVDHTDPIIEVGVCVLSTSDSSLKPFQEPPTSAIPPRRVASLPRLSTLLKRARSQSVGSPKNKPRTTLPQSPSLKDVQRAAADDASAHSHNAEPPLPFPSSLESVPARHPAIQVLDQVVVAPAPRSKHTKGFSFLSFSSSEDHHEYSTPESGNNLTTELVCQTPTPPTPTTPKPTIRRQPAPPPVIPIPSTPTRSPPTLSTGAQLRALTPSPTCTEGSCASTSLVTPTNLSPITRPPSFLAARPVVKSKSQSFLGIATDETTLGQSLSALSSPVNHRPTSWVVSSDIATRPSLRSSSSFTSNSLPTSPTRPPSTFPSQGRKSKAKALLLLGIGDLPPSSTMQSGHNALPPMPPTLSQPQTTTSSPTGSSGVKRLWRALTMRKTTAGSGM
ncbi:uncharacterized protein EV420DRAFT_1659392 [Desarmillaria tabescens]|uniref:Uncharacterized protein n=1 Tax=Armillaria tabescens TaxID=1929756 RepID=A0AA39TT42_ARMTA|nr:uncharacterized protein EV420DRAFT_1659392 [Desarmillaria tabescens]KAK0469362.1 hypothetical protein EV420DRAFT_1659392 [Desarmillaria tabescens]